MSDKKYFLYEEGHKRETRKSYKAYLEEMAVGIKNEDTTGENELVSLFFNFMLTSSPAIVCSCHIPQTVWIVQVR